MTLYSNLYFCVTNVADYRLRYHHVRNTSEALAAPLSPEDQAVQSMPDASPTKWHLAHTTWFFETFLLIPHLPEYEVFDPAFNYLFNSYYETIGPRQPRPGRGLITRPSASDVKDYRAHVDAEMSRLLDRLSPELVPLIELGLSHEEQHQELILMDVLHLFSRSPFSPAYRPGMSLTYPSVGPMTWHSLQGGIVEIGATGREFAFDNETPRHKVYLPPYAMADRLVTNGEWLAFMADDGYRRPELWLADGWARVQSENWRAPLYWRPEEGNAWSVIGLGGRASVDPCAPVLHVSYYEAAAYAEWADARLPTEAEWEHAAATGTGLRELYTEAWQWTRSAYDAYPGFHPSSDAVGEYNGKFMVGQMSLRGGSSVTPPGHTRATYRNFFPPSARWMFSGVRLAKDANDDASRLPSAFTGDIIDGLSGPGT